MMLPSALGSCSAAACDVHIRPFMGARICATARPRRHQRVARARAAAVASPEAANQLTPLNNLFEDACKYHDVQVSVKLEHSTEGSGIGLFAVRSISQGDTILRVPKSLCIILDNDTGSLSIPKGDWPRLTGGIMQETALTWDILMALALMDATAGNGDQFWELYSDHFLQQPENLILPMCWSDDLLQQLQHSAIVAAAQQQQQRLRTLLPPEYMQPIDQGLPSYLQWGFANVRSRALQLGPQAFGMVPFIDIANHAADPNADVRTVAAAGSSSSDGSAAAGDNAEQGFVELYAIKGIPAGQEVTISYSGLAGYTNQRWMAQYGFVPAAGNAADLLDFNISESHKGATFRLSYLEDALGSQLLMDAAKGTNPYLMAALKSLPLTADDPVALQQATVETNTQSAVEGPAVSGAESSVASSTGRGIGHATKEEVELAALLMQQVQQELQSSSSSLQEDEKLLRQLQDEVQNQSGSEAAAEFRDVVLRDARLVAAVKYRVERKKLLQACRVLLNIFLRE